MSEYRYGDYWSRVGERYAREDPLGAVCWDGAPPWFNRFFARFQVRAVERAMRAEFGDMRREGRALDLGCGTGRWTRWLDRWWTDTIGVDISRGMLAAADPAHRYLQGDVTRLPFADATFDYALTVTVLLHLPHEAQRLAIAEVARTLKPSGTLVLLEMVNRVADRAHVFPNSIERWSELLDEAGLAVRRSEGEAQAPLLRVAFAAAARLGPRPSGGETDDVKRGGQSGATASAIGGLRGPAQLAARAAVAASYPLEHAAVRLLPAGMALNVCLLARKR